MWFRKRKQEKVFHVHIPSMSLGFILDTGLWDDEAIENFELLNRIIDQAPVSEDVMEMELDASLDRREDVEIITQVLVSLSAVFVNTMVSSIKHKKNDIPEEIADAFDAKEFRAYIVLLMSSFAQGIVSQLIESGLIKRGWEDD